MPCSAARSRAGPRPRPSSLRRRRGVTVVAGGTILMPDLAPAPARRSARCSRPAGLVGVARDGGRTTIGAMTTVAELVDGAAEPLGASARNVADLRSAPRPRSAATCARRPARERPRGDLQARADRARRAGPLGRRRRRAHRAGRGFLAARAAGSCSTSPSEPRPAGQRAGRPTRTPTRCSRVRRAPDGERPARRRLRRRSRARCARAPVEAPPEAAAAVARRRRPPTTRWPRLVPRAVLPVLVRGRSTTWEERMRLTVNGIGHEVALPAAHEPPARLREELEDHEPEGRLPAGRLRRLHGARRRRTAPRVPAAVAAVDGAEVTTVEGLGEAEDARRRSRPPSTSNTPHSAASARRACVMAADGLSSGTASRRPRAGDGGAGRGTCAAVPAT